VVSIAEQVELTGKSLASGAGTVAVIELASASGNGGQRPRPRPRRRRPPRRMAVLAATASSSGRILQAWCPFCRGHHTHGRHGAAVDCERWLGTACGCELHASLHGPSHTPCTCPPGSGDGHRGAHCTDGPLRQSGYWVTEIPLAGLVWPLRQPPRPLEDPPPVLMAEAVAGGMTVAQARQLWSCAVEAASRLQREVAR
jgi:hypothetical protein